MSDRAARRPALSNAALAAALVVLAIGSETFGCSRDHGFLASTSTGGSSGGGHRATSSSSSGSGGSGGAGAGGSNQGGEPNGPPRLTVLDAIVDAAAIRVCFVPYPSGDPAAMPWPGTAGLAYGDARQIESASGVIPSATDVEAIVIGGDLTQTAGMTCDAIVAAAGTGSGGGASTGAGGAGGASSSGAGAGGGSSGGGGASANPFVAASLGVLPASVFTAKQSLLLAPAGCLGGAGHDDPNAAMLVCGDGYTSSNPTARLAALALSREVTPGRLALQLVQASVATPDLMVDIAPTKDAAAAVIATTLPFGGAEPTPPFVGFTVDALASSGQIIAYPTTGGVPLSTTSIGDAFAHGDAGDLSDGHAYALVAIGPSPGAEVGSWWNAFIWTAVRSDP